MTSKTETETETFYVSLVGDLRGCYLKFEADCEEVVRMYLVTTYLSKTNLWKLPWHSIYKEMPEIDAQIPIVIPAKSGPLHLDDYKYRNGGKFKKKRDEKEYLRGRKNGLLAALEPNADLKYLEMQSDTISWKDDPYDKGFVSAVRTIMKLCREPNQ